MFRNEQAFYQLVTQLGVLLDEAEAGVVVVATTSLHSSIHPSLLRVGRLDQVNLSDTDVKTII